MIYAIMLPIVIATAPWLIVRYILTTPSSKKMPYRKAMPYLWSSAIIWTLAVSLWELDVRLSVAQQTDTFALHTMGGIVASILFFFVIKAYDLRFKKVWQKPILLFFFVSGMGVTNELFELFLNRTGILVVPVHENDTWWDLVANTLGGFIGYFCALIFVRFKSKQRR